MLKSRNIINIIYQIFVLFNFYIFILEKQKTTYYSVGSQIKPTDGASGMTSSMFFLTFVMAVYALFR